MILLKIDALSDAELRYIAEQEKIEGWESLSREELVDEIRELHEEESDVSKEADANNGVQRFFNCLTEVQMNRLLSLPGVEALPDDYLDTSIHLLLKDPFWGYAFWSISPITQSQCKDRDPACRIFMRSVASNPDGKVKDVYNIDIGPDDRSWTIALPWRGCSYKVELVAEFPSTQVLEVLASSETIVTPAAIDPKILDSIRNTSQASLILSCLCSKNGEIIGNKLVLDLFSRINSQTGAAS